MTWKLSQLVLVPKPVGPDAMAEVTDVASVVVKNAMLQCVVRFLELSVMVVPTVESIVSQTNVPVVIQRKKNQ